MPSRTITETTGAAGFDTPYTLRIGDVFQGTVSSSGDHDDYIAIQVVEGRSYMVTATSQ